MSDKPGHFKLADGGTLFLDEIADLPQFMQVKLLRVLKDGSFTPVGDVKEGRSDVRIISATNKDLRKQVQDGSFREDLFYRIVRMEITLPPLRDRGNDIVRIAQHIVAQLNQKYGQRKVLDQSAADMIMKHHWPGNVRELKSALETAFVLAEDRIRAENLNIIDLRPETRDILIPDEGIDLGNEVLPRYYEAALKKTGGNRAQAARLLGMAPHTFRARLKKLGK
ncbi:MAG: hypothetical protein DRI57_30185 [Deltaproteobacteria bacterium]|nr:MAG: hypothetical protein DRI57_30185 [Deltaproteobacteria bacterium]